MSDTNIQKTYQQLCKLENRLRACEKCLIRLGNARVPVYLSVPNQAAQGFRAVYQSICQMKQVLGGEKDLPEG